MNKLSRNDLCWCGSGKKYKKCHMDTAGGEIPRALYANPDKTKMKPHPDVIIKTPDQIEKIRQSSIITKSALDMISSEIKEGVTTNRLNNLIHEFILSHKGIPAPLNYKGFPKSICTSLNNVVCHGIPDNTVLKDGDIINIDVTVILNGYYSDAGRMFTIGKVSDQAKKLIEVTKECLHIGIEQVKPFKDIGEIGYAIERHAKKNGFSVVRDYGGHGVGLSFHEQPHIHHYGSKNRGVKMFPNMTFTIEPMINAGKYETRLLKDDWTAVTADGSLSAQWEHTVRVTEDGAEVLTA